jgi:voltage-gated potassium channel
MLLVLILMAGTLGYAALEGWPVLDALYMTIITITTVGFAEVNVVSSGGRIFTICIIFMGMGIMAYSLGMVAQIMVKTQVKTVLGRQNGFQPIVGNRYRGREHPHRPGACQGSGPPL